MKQLCEMDAFLQEAARHGIQDSRGVFTINVEKAEIKLAKFQLAKLEQFPMFLLAAGTAAGASRFTVSFHGHKTRIRYEGWTLTSADFHTIGMQALKEGTPRPIRFLAIAFSTIGSRYDFNIRSGDLKVGFVNMTMQFLETREPVEEFPGLEIEIDARLELEFDEGLIGQQKFCPFPVVIGSRELPGGYDPSVESVDSYAYLHRGGQGLYAVNLKYADKVLLDLPEERGKVPILLSFTYPSEAETLGFWILVNGLACRAPADFAPAGFYGVAAGGNLELSLSYEIVKNTAFQKFRLQVCEACLQLCDYTQSRTGAKSRINKRMLEDAFKSAERQLPLQRRAAHPNPPEEIEAAVKDGVEPVRDQELLASLLTQLSDLDETHLDALLSAYRRKCLHAKREGRYEEMLEWHHALLEVRKTLDRHSERDLLAHYVLQIIQKPGDLPSTEHLHNLELSSRESMLARAYLSYLEAWAKGEDVPSHLPAVHNTWLFPFVPHLQAEECWFRLFVCLEGGQAPEALALIRTEPSLFYEGHEHAWLQYFWEHHRGQLSWVESIKLRVRLTFSAEAEAEDFSSYPLLEAALRIVREEASRPPFWPHFMTLLHRARRWGSDKDRRLCWSLLFLEGLATGYLSSDGSPPLIEAFSPGHSLTPGASNWPSPGLK